MLETLRDPIWNSISAIVAIAALVIALYQDKRKYPSLSKVFTAISRILLGILVFFIGVPLEFTVFHILRGGLPMAVTQWQYDATIGILQRDMLRSLFFSLFVGSIIVTSIPKDNSKKNKVQTTLVSIIALWITDIFFFLFGQVGDSPLILSLFSDVIGGFIGGMIVLWLARIYDDNFA